MSVVGAGRGQFDALGATEKTSHVSHHTRSCKISSGFESRPIFEGIHLFNIPGAISHVAEQFFCAFHRLTHFEAL